MLQFLSSYDLENTFSLYSIDVATLLFFDTLLTAIDNFVAVKVIHPPEFPRRASYKLKKLNFEKKNFLVYCQTFQISL